jgi:hypothetical protein
MRYPVSSVLVFAGAFLVAGSALALNPQPLPPGKAHTMHEPPDPCMKAQIGSATSGAGAGKVRMRKAGGEQMMMRKAGGEQSNVHCLNPQPLPPG